MSFKLKTASFLSPLFQSHTHNCHGTVSVRHYYSKSTVITRHSLTYNAIWNVSALFPLGTVTVRRNTWLGSHLRERGVLPSRSLLFLSISSFSFYLLTFFFHSGRYTFAVSHSISSSMVLKVFHNITRLLTS